jgi:hypothetical protein
LSGHELLRILRHVHRLEGRHLQPGQLLLQIGCPILFFDGKLVLAGNALGFFSLSHPLTDDASAAE